MKPIFIELPVRCYTEEGADLDDKGMLDDNSDKNDDFTESIVASVNICLIERIMLHRFRKDICYIHMGGNSFPVNLPKGEVEHLIEIKCL